MKANVLIIPRHIKSHLIPALYLAKILAEKYNVYFAVSSDELAAIASSNGYRTASLSNFYLGEEVEEELLRHLHISASKRNVLHTIVSDRVRKYREDEYRIILAEVRPVAIFLDIFISSDYLIIHRCFERGKTLYFNPMLSLFVNDYFPDVRGKVKPGSEPQKRDSSGPKGFINRVIDRLRKRQFERSIRDSRLERVELCLKGKFKFAGVRELILAPKQLEFTQDFIQGDQVYLGLSLIDQRVDPEVDSGFMETWLRVLDEKKAGKQIVYCSFGSYNTGSFDLIYRFLVRLIKAVDAVGTAVLVCAVHPYIYKTYEHLNPPGPSVVFFSFVPQVRVLQESDIFITHGGLGSVKEGVSACVPMYVFPIDQAFDQPGNAQKVEYHRLGKAGDLRSTPVEVIRDNVWELLSNPAYKQNVQAMRDSIMSDNMGNEMAVKLHKMLDEC